MVNKVAQRAIAAGLAGMMSFGAVAPAAMALDTHNWSSWWDWHDTTTDEGLTYWRRIAGDDRYGTMKKIVEAAYSMGSDNWWNASVAVVASGDNFPDALAANGLAGALNNGDGAPVILTKKGALSSQAKELLQKMCVQTVYIMGGTSAVSEATENAIKDLKIATVRVAGADRQATSVAAFKLIDGNWYKNHGTHSVIIATGANYADALSIAPFAYRTGTPVVLTKADGTLTDEAVKAIKDNDEIYQVIVVGGSAVVSDNVFGVLGTYNGSYRDYYNKVYVPIRIAGADRYDTSAKIADWEINYAFDIKGEVNSKTNYWMGAGFSFNEVFVATGENFPDALAGGQLAGGKWYAKKTTVYTNNSTRVPVTEISPTIKCASPILLTKDGDRAADSVIAANLAWNWNKVSVDAYDFFSGNLASYIDSYLTPGSITLDVYDNNAYGFFTDSDFSGIFSATTYDATIWDILAKVFSDTALTQDELDTFNKIIRDVDLDNVLGSWIDGYRVVDDNFNGVIFGGKAAVSKDKAKQLDDTVKDSIRKVNDPIGNYASDTYVVNINGKTYKTLGWVMDKTTSWWTNLGVQGWNWSTWTTTNAAGRTAENVIAVPNGTFKYLYQPVDHKVINTQYNSSTGAVEKQRVVIQLVRFNRDSAYGFAATNSYTGYGCDQLGILVVDYDYVNPSNTTATYFAR